jgi:hypothetical protein
MNRSRTGHFKTNATLSGDGVRGLDTGLGPDSGTNLGTELNGMDANEQDLTVRDLASKDASVATGAPVGRSLSGAPLPGAAGSNGKGLGKGLGRAAAGLGRALGVPSGAQEEQDDEQSGGHKALSVLRQALPVVKNLLPLLEGNLLAAVSNMLATRPQNPAKVDLAPLENQLTEMQLLQHDVRGKVAEHRAALKRVEDHLEMVKEATDRNTMEQQELMEDLRAMGSKVNLFAAMLIGLLVLSVILNFLLFMHIKQVLP